MFCCNICCKPLSCCLHTKSFSCVWLFVMLWTVAHQAPLSMGFSRQEYWSGCHALLQGIFLTPRLNPHILLWQVDSSPLRPPGKPFVMLLVCNVAVTSSVILCHANWKWEVERVKEYDNTLQMSPLIPNFQQYHIDQIILHDSHRSLDHWGNRFLNSAQMCTCVCVCVCVCVCMLNCFSHVWLFATPWNGPARLHYPWDSPGRNTGVGCHVLLQGIFQTQGLNPRLSYFLHWQAGFLPLAPPVKHS